MELTKEFFEEQLKNLATKDSLDNLKEFVEANLITKKGFDDRLAELPTKADFTQLLEAVDGIAKQFKDQEDEKPIGASRSKRMEDWIIEAAKKIGVQYKP